MVRPEDVCQCESAPVCRALIVEVLGRERSVARDVDVCIYGATPAGCLAAIAARQEGASVLLVEPSRWLGGMLGAGIKPLQDCPLPAAVGGLTRQVFGLGNTPLMIRASFRDWLRDELVPVVYEHRLQSVDLSNGYIQNARFGFAPPDRWGIPAPELLSGPIETVQAAVFIDASYEGDFLPAARVAYRTGRESSQEFREKPAGVGPATLWCPIDPYVAPGSPNSGLLPMVEPDHGLPKGASDTYTQAYNFRLYLTTDPKRRVPFTRPDDYVADDYELVGRYALHIVDACDSETEVVRRLRGIFPGWLNEGEYNYFRESLITIAPLGLSKYYQDGDWPTRSTIWRKHIDYVRGLHTFLSSDRRIPRQFRERTALIGLDRTMHPDTDGWPHQLYVRVARRVEGEYTLTHADVLNQTSVDDGIGLALYGVDTYPVRRFACKDSYSSLVGVATEGNMFLGSALGTGHPYPVPYRTITPKATDCRNLLVPVCFSATHIAYASARMEPVFCVLGESAGVAAAAATRAGSAVQELNTAKLRRRLAQRDQVLDWPVK